VVGVVPRHSRGQTRRTTALHTSPSKQNSVEGKEAVVLPLIVVRLFFTSQEILETQPVQQETTSTLSDFANNEGTAEFEDG